jgi:HSP20 family protein
MTLVKFNRKPFEKNLDGFVDGFFNEFPSFLKNELQAGWNGSAPVNIHETEKAYSLDVVAPGFEKADFKINLDQDILTISAEKKEEVKEENKKQVRREYSYRSFKRSFTLDEKIDAAAIEAQYVNGVLTLNLPKKETVKEEAKQINVK